MAQNQSGASCAAKTGVGEGKGTMIAPTYACAAHVSNQTLLTPTSFLGALSHVLARRMLQRTRGIPMKSRCSTRLCFAPVFRGAVPMVVGASGLELANP